MTGNELQTMGVRKYGTQWFTRLALDMGVSETTVRRWASGAQPINIRAENHIRLVFAQRDTCRS